MLQNNLKFGLKAYVQPNMKVSTIDLEQSLLQVSSFDGLGNESFTEDGELIY